MLARTLLDHHYGDFEALLMAVAQVLADQVRGLPCACIQIDEANIPVATQPMAPSQPAPSTPYSTASTKAPKRPFHFCFGNYGGQLSSQGEWRALLDFLNELRADHLVLELAHRPASDLSALQQNRLAHRPRHRRDRHARSTTSRPPIEVARRIEAAVSAAGPERICFIHPDCGFWMLKRSIAARKIAALAEGRDLYLG